MTENEITKEELDLLNIPAAYVPKAYEMNPKTDDLISGFDLEDGMIVLIEGSIMREDPRRANGTWPQESEVANDYAKIRARETARWCKVTKYLRMGPICSFIGLYADGTKISRQYNEFFYWIVKK